MKSDWNVDEAINEVMARIHEGSALPFLKQPDDRKLKNAYHERFQSAHDMGVIDWNLARTKILPLAYMVGALATMLAAADQASKKTDSKPERVLPQHAWRAAYLISKVCTYEGADGAICPRMPLPEGCGSLDDNKKIIDSLRTIFTILKLV